MINWLKYKSFYFIISGILVAVSIFSLLRFGLRPGIDFVGGSLIELAQEKNQISKAEIETLFTDQEITVQSMQKIGEKGLLINSQYIEQKKGEELKKLIKKSFAEIEIVRFETVGPTLGKELLVKTITAAVIAILGMLLYIAWAFKNIRYGIAAVLALLHDSIILLGSFSLLGHFAHVEIDTLFVTAVLTTMSFSVHDTVVVFNKVREKIHKTGDVKITNFANEALTETMVRSVNNSLTILFMLLALILLGGETIRWFVTALLIGTLLGTYSSPFVAVPILTLLRP